MISPTSQMHDALLAAEHVLADMDAMLKRKHPGLATMPELVLVRAVLARYAGEGA
jgi:hypothetical protein